MRNFYFLSLFFLLSVSGKISGQEEVFFYEGFEGGARPAGWTEEVVQGPAEYWRYRNGGHNPNDPNNLIPPGDLDLGRNPDRAYSGTYNAYFQKESTNNERTMLVTPEINLEFAVKPELRFWHAQVPWVWSGQSYWDHLRVYYKTSAGADWVLLAEFLEPLEDWTRHFISLPNHTATYYLAFEGHTRWGHGVVLDEIEIVETGEVERYVQSMTVTQASTNFVIAGSENNEILRLHLKVYGNTGDLFLESLTVRSLNTDDGDIPDGGVKLFRTNTSLFSPANQLGTPAGFIEGQAVISNIDYNLPTGDTYLWVTYDVDPLALHGNIVDAMTEAGSIMIGGDAYPATGVSPPGSRTIFETIFYDNFEEDKGWMLSGEFEIAVPEGGGGWPGGPNPAFAYSGTKVLGTDLTGLGAWPYKYEPGLSDTSLHCQAVSPPIDLFYFKNVFLRFRQWLNVDYWDGAYIEISNDGGQQWNQIWRNNDFVTDIAWHQKSYDISSLADRREEIFIRFGIGNTDDFNNYSGWNIDNFIITGEYITRDVGVTEWIGPSGDCGMGSSETVTVRVENFAAIPNTDPIPVAYSIDGGISWVQETITETIPVGGSLVYSFTAGADFSNPGLYPVMAVTSYPGDQEPANDGLETEILSIPVHTMPFREGFEESKVIFWREGGTNSSWAHGNPAGEVIDSAAEGFMAWVTNPEGVYNEGESSWVEGPCFDLSGNNYPVFEMKSWWHTSGPEDYASVLYSVDDRQSWHLLGSQGDGDEYSWNWYNSPSGWSGEGEGWVISRNIMSPALVGQENVCFRIAFTSSAGEKVHEGFAFDDVRIYNIPDDVGAVSIIDPVSGCAYPYPAGVSMEIENFGLEGIEAGSEIVAGFDVNGENRLIESFFLEHDLPVGGTIVYTFDGSVDMSAEGEFELTAYTLMDGDTDFYNQGITNDTIHKVIGLSPMPLLDLGPDIYTVLPDTVVLDAWAGVEGYDYLWQDGSTGHLYHVSDEGLFHVVATDEFGCFAVDSVSVVKLIVDAGVTELLAPLSSCELGTEESLEVLVKNFGTDTLLAGSQVDIYARISLGEPFVEALILEEDLLPEGTVSYTFEDKFDFSVPGGYNITVWIDLDYDDNPLNDTLDVIIEVYGYPVVDLGPDVSLAAFEYELDAGGPFVSYLWQDGSTNRYFIVDQQGEAVYHVTVTDENNCFAWDEVTVKLSIIDIAVDSILSPVTSCGLPDEVSVSARFSNSGNATLETGTAVLLGYNINGGEDVTEELFLPEDLEPGESFLHDFDPVSGLEEGNWYDFTVFVVMDDDMVAENDYQEVPVGIFEPALIDLGDNVTSASLSYTVDAGPGFVSYLWHDGSTEQTFTVTEPGINNVWVTVTDENGCQATDGIQVLILIFDIGVTELQTAEEACTGTPELLRAAVRNFGNTNIAEGTNIQIACSVDEGPPVIESLSLASTFGAGQVIWHDFAAPVEFSGPGEITLTAWTIYASDLISANDSMSTAVTVHQTTPVDIGDGQDHIFTWSPVMLDAGAGFASYLWQDGSGGQTYTVDEPVTGYFHVTVTDMNNCVASDTVHVTFPVAELAVTEIMVPPSGCELSGNEQIGMRFRNQGDHSIPYGETVMLSYRVNQGAAVSEALLLDEDMAPSSVISYYFETGAGLSLPGSYQIVATADIVINGYSYSGSLATGVEVYGYPVADLAGGADTLYASLPVTLDAGSGFASYLWSDSSTGQTLEVTAFGEYWVEVEDGHGCRGTTFVYVESPLGIHAPFSGGQLSVFPNPVADRLFVRIETDAVQEMITVELTDVRGVKVYINEIRQSARFEDEIDVGRMSPGMYFLQVKTDGHRETRRIIVR